MDACETAFDTPLMYGKGGWGKQLTRVIAVEADGMEDVTQRYMAEPCRSELEACRARACAAGQTDAWLSELARTVPKCSVESLKAWLTGNMTAAS